VTVVFDALRAPPTAADALEYQGIQVFFTRDEEADDLIERLIRRASAPRLLTVVSDDHRVRDAARRRKCAVVECADFWDFLAQRPRPRAAAPGGEPKRDGVSHGEAQEWLREFAGLADDPDFKELFDPYDFGDAPAP